MRVNLESPPSDALFFFFQIHEIFHGSYDLVRSTNSGEKELLNPENFPENVFIKSEMKRKMKELGYKEEKKVG